MLRRMRVPPMPAEQARRGILLQLLLAAASSPPPSPPSAASVLLDGLTATDHTFLSFGVPSKLYKWDDFVSAATKMSTIGVGGLKLYATTDRSESGHGPWYGLANVAAFLAQAMQETIQYDACDENNWSDHTQPPYPASAACGQLDQSYQDYACSGAIVDPETGQTVPAEEVQCAVQPEMELRASSKAGWYGAPPPLFCAPRSKVPHSPHWDNLGWCPAEGKSWNQGESWAPPFDTVSRGEVYYGPEGGTSHLPPEVLAVAPGYLDYVARSTGKATGELCKLSGECCMEYVGQKAGSWQACEGGCSNGEGTARTDVEGCCWWGRGVIQMTGVCNFGRLNFFLGARRETHAIRSTPCACTSHPLTLSFYMHPPAGIAQARRLSSGAAPRFTRRRTSARTRASSAETTTPSSGGSPASSFGWTLCRATMRVAPRTWTRSPRGSTTAPTSPTRPSSTSPRASSTEATTTRH